MKHNTRRTVLGGIISAIVIICLYFGVVLKNNSIFFTKLSNYIL
jgi:hypothetical protein